MARRRIGYALEKGRVSSRDLATKERKSSCVADCSYDPEHQQMTIIFIERGTFVYYDIPVHLWVEFNGAGSRGTYFNLYIRDAGYDYERIG